MLSINKHIIITSRYNNNIIIRVLFNLHFSNLWCIKYYYRRDNNIDSVLCLLLFFVSCALKLFPPTDIADSAAAAAAVVHLHKVIRYYRIGHRWRVRFVSGQRIKNGFLCALSAHYPPTLRPQLPLLFFFRRTHNNKRAEQIRTTEYCIQCEARRYYIMYGVGISKEH